jgi:enterochelin esterase-like enzyme
MIHVLACLTLAAVVLLEQSSAAPFAGTIAEDISAGQSRRFVAQADAGDFVGGAALVTGVDGTVRFEDANGSSITGARITSFPLGAGRERRVGFIAPEKGTYYVVLTASGTGSGRFSLRAERNSVAVRMRDVVPVAPKVVYPSPRIQELARRVQNGERSAVEDFWREVSGHGPLVEPASERPADQPAFLRSEPPNRDLLVTFLWRQTYETRNVLVSWSDRPDDYYMSHLDGTDVWYKTIRIRRGSRFSYALSPNERADDWLFTARLDPLNPRVFPDDPAITSDRNSVLDTPGAPDDSWVGRQPRMRGSVEEQPFKSAVLGNERLIWIYTPPQYSPARGPYPVLLFIDGDVYVSASWINAPATLDNLINDGRIRPVVACFIRTLSRAADFSVKGDYGKALATELLPLLRSRLAVSASPKDVILAGFSAGATTAARVALNYPQAFGGVLSQSGSFRGRGDSGDDEPNTVSRVYIQSARAPLRFYLETGLYEPYQAASLPFHEMVLDEGNTQGNRHFRDVLRAKGYDVVYRETGTAHEFLHWRATLADGLLALLSR